MTKASESQKISFSNALFENSGNQNQLSVTPQFSVLESQNYAENEIIIKFKSGLNADLQSFAANTLQSSMQATLASTTQSLGSQLWQIKGMSVEAAIAAYQDHPSIEYIQPNYQLQLANSADAAPSREGHLADLATDPGMASLWGLHNTGQTGGTVDADIDAPEAWDLSLGRDVVVGVIDSGVDYTHPDLDDNIWINSGEIAGNGIDDDGNGYVDDYIGYDFVSGDADPYDENGHGTHVAGTIAAEANNGLGVVGVAPEAKIMALKIFDAQGNTNAFAAIQAIEYATMMGADITNNSWGGGSYSQALYDAIAAAEQAGQVFVAAAGNGGFDGIGDNNDFFPNYPSNYDVDNIIAVGASDHRDFLGGFSNYGASTVDITAPGVDIVSTVPGGYDTFSGTSMATPHVAGVAALLLAQDPNLTPQEVRQILIDSADPVAVQAGATVADGRLNAYSALSGIQSQAGSIQGSVWHDVDEDGIWDANEAALNDWTIYLDQNQNGQLDSGEQSAVTDTNGSYSFTGLAAGQYTVAEVVPTGWEQTSPSSHETNVFSTSAQILPSISTTGSTTAIQTYGEVVALDPELQITPQTDISGPLINIDDFRQDNRFAGIDGSGFATVILDSGIDLDHSFFGPDTNGDGISDRIVYQYDFADEDADASDVDGHGSNVSSIVASSDSVHTGMAPGADIIHLKVFGDDGSGNFADVEQALQWVVDNADNYNIASVNMSLGDTSNWNTAQSQYGLGDELAALAAMDVITVSASGNDFYGFNSEQGVSYPAADPNSLSVGAIFDRDMGSVSWLSGAEAYFSDADQVTPISQRHETLTSIFAPGAPITGAGADGGLVSMTGTSQAAPHIAGVVALAQQLAQDTLGRRLTLDEFSNLLVTSGVTVNDGDDEYDNVTNTGLNFKRVDVFALGEAILALNSNASVPGTHTVTVTAGETVTDINFGNRQLPTSSATNFSFETGDFSGWQVQGDGTLQTSSIGVAPT
ncbi:MAG: S8 family serine peptidase, partial [Cyanobacteria bacterium P01_F01_bin.86]